MGLPNIILLELQKSKTSKVNSQKYISISMSAVWKIFPFGKNENILNNCLDKRYNVFQTTRFNHTMIFFKLTDQYKFSDIYTSYQNCLGHILIT